MSIKSKINLSFLVLGILSALAIALFNYFEIKNKVIDNAFKKAELINSFAVASRTYTVKTMRPLAMEMAGPGEFHPEIMGGFFVARAIAETFSKEQPGYSFKQATIDPINPQNAADYQEQVIIRQMKDDRNLTIQKGIMQKYKQRYFYIAKPVIAQKGCLKCHGDPKAAPIGRRTRYPGGGGYNYEENDVIAAFITYVPVEKALSEVNMSTLKIAVIGIAFIIGMFVVVWFLIDKIITKPVVALTELADEVSRGNDLEKTFTINSKDEIGDLYQSFDRMRKSVVKLMRMVKKTK